MADQQGMQTPDTPPPPPVAPEPLGETPYAEAQDSGKPRRKDETEREADGLDFGVVSKPGSPEDSPLNQDGYLGVDPIYQTRDLD